MSYLPPVRTQLEYPYTRSTGPIVGAFLTGLRDGKLLSIRCTGRRAVLSARVRPRERGDAGRSISSRLISGLAEIVLGGAVLEPRTRVFAAWGIIALLVAVFPANLYVASQNLGPPDLAPGTGNAALNLARLPMQLVFVLWAWWYTRPDGVRGGHGSSPRA